MHRNQALQPHEHCKGLFVGEDHIGAGMLLVAPGCVFLLLGSQGEMQAVKLHPPMKDRCRMADVAADDSHD